MQEVLAKLAFGEGRGPVSAEHWYVVFVEETLTCVVVFAVPSTLVSDVKRPMTAAVATADRVT